jgi:hypothetical protein
MIFEISQLVTGYGDADRERPVTSGPAAGLPDAYALPIKRVKK